MTMTAVQAWDELSVYSSEFKHTHLRALFAKDPARAKSFSLSFDGLFYDYSKQRVDAKALGLLFDLAEKTRLKDAIERMFGGEVINVSEHRSVLHTALRNHTDTFPTNDFNVMPEVLKTRQRMNDFAERLRSGKCQGHQGMPIQTIINIGIGGSDLGPKMMAYALRAMAHPTLAVHFVSNLDGAQLAPLLQTLDPRTTLFIVVSKTFTTQETMVNANTAREWLRSNLGTQMSLENHFAAVSSRPERAMSFGIREDRVFPIWDWVGGRYSLWSAVGLPLMIAIGPKAFNEMLIGAELMDNHFRHTAFEQNLPVIMALLGVWNTNFLGAETLAMLPYNESLKFFPSYLQQLEMESNGKSVRLDGTAVTSATCPIVWGELGNNGQHAFFQLLHQGGRLVPCDFIAAVHSDFPLPDHQEALLANCFAQSSALAFGKTEAEVKQSLEEEMLNAQEIAELLPHRIFAGNQPSSTLLLKSLNPRALGSLVALYEHKVFVQGIIWGVNSFDQWGVELGKAMASKILPAISQPELDAGFDSSTQGLLAFTRKYL